MGRCLATILVLSSALVLAACGGHREPDPPAAISGSPRSAAIAGNPLTQVREGMTKGQVRNLAGTPHEEANYQITPFHLPGISTDPKIRTEWLYRGSGRVVFAETVQRGGVGTVVRVEIEKPPPGLRK
jgi:hypothetical protein